MSKSNYPNKIDTSIEIPQVRDNITEIGSDVINSLRSAIFQIEKTLGINPQGSAGNTVANRLSKIVDESGNLKKEAVDKANILSGPITDSDVSKSAGINETKLKLNFPTQVLQNEISIIDSKLEQFILALNDLNAKFSAHVNVSAINRHPAKAITVDGLTSTPSGSAVKSLQSETLQLSMERLYNSHINYTGESIDSTNNSHAALQVYYDNTDTSDIINSSSVQGAIDDIANLQGISIRNSILNLNSNGIIRTGLITDSYENLNKANSIIDLNSISYSDPVGSSKMSISFTELPTPGIQPKTFDILTISGSPNASDNKDYFIASANINGSGKLVSVEVFGGPKFSDSGGISARITQNQYTNYNENSLNCTVRPRYLASNTPDVQVALPGAATIISSGCKPGNIVVGTNNILTIEIDGVEKTINVAEPTLSVQNIDTIVYAINKIAVQNRLNIFAYKLRSLKCYELAISHVMPNISEDITNRTLKIKVSSSNDASSDLGFTYILNNIVEGTVGSSAHINGYLLQDFGLTRKLTIDSVNLNISTTTISAANSNINFFELGIRVGDLCVIQGSSSSSDDGTYRISQISSGLITLDSSSYSFAGDITDGAIFIVKSTAPIGELEFLEVDGSILFDVFVDENKEIYYSKRFDQSGHLQSGLFYSSISDISKGYLIDGDTVDVKVNTSGYAYLQDPVSLQTGQQVFVASTGRYKVFSPDGSYFVYLDVYTDGVPAANITATLTGSNDIPDSVLHLCRGVYSTNYGFILGTPSLGVGGAIPTLIDKRITGTVDDTIISQSFIERYIEGPRNELRSSGSISGVELTVAQDNLDGTCYIDVTSGVVIANGIRHEFFGVTDHLFRYGTDGADLNNFYIAIDETGCLIIQIETDIDGSGNYVSPFYNRNVAHVAYVVINGANTQKYDMRMFVDNLDYKLTTNIVVAKDSRFGHFTDIKKAVIYARKFTQLFPSMKTVNIFIKSGTYSITERISLDFDIKISGDGTNTILERGSTFFNTDNTLTQFTSNDFQKIPFVIGSETNGSSTRIVNGVTLENFVIKSNNLLVSGKSNSLIAITQDIEDSENSIFRLNNIHFIGTTGLTEGTCHEFALVITRPISVGLSNLKFGNVIVTNCYGKYIGNENIAIATIIDNSATNSMQNIIINNCIFKSASPIQLNVAAGTWSPFGAGNSTSIDYALTTIPLVTNINDVIISNIADLD